MTITKIKNKNKEITLTLQEAVQLSHKCERTLRSWIKSGKLPAKKVNGSYQINRSDLARITPVPDNINEGSSNLETERNVEEYAILLQRHEQAMFRLGQLESENKQLQESVKRLPPPEEYVVEKYKMEDIINKLSQAEKETERLKENLTQAEKAKIQLQAERQKLQLDLQTEYQKLQLDHQKLQSELELYKQSAWGKIKTMLVGAKI